MKSIKFKIAWDVLTLQFSFPMILAKSSSTLTKFYVTQSSVWNPVHLKHFAPTALTSYIIYLNKHRFHLYWGILHIRSQWPRGLRRRSAAARLPRLWIRIPPGAWMSVCCECCVLSDRGLCVKPISRPEESHQVCVCVSVTMKPR